MSSSSSSLVEKGGYYYYYDSRNKLRLGPLVLTHILISLLVGDFTAAWRRRLAGDKPSRAAKRGASGVAGYGDTTRATNKNPAPSIFLVRGTKTAIFTNNFILINLGYKLYTLN